MTIEVSPEVPNLPAAAIATCAQALLDAAPITSAYHLAIATTLAVRGNILSDTRNMRWARLVWVCCTAAGGDWTAAVTAAAAVELFMVALDTLDDVEDDEASPTQIELGLGRTLNVSTGLLFLANISLLDSAHFAKAARILSEAGLMACSGQHADLKVATERPLQLDESLAITAQKSAALVSAICRLGALCGGADEAHQLLFARYGSHLGMVLQLANDIGGIHPKAQKKTDITLARPTLPLTYAMLYNGERTEAAHAQSPDLWTGGAAYLTWTVAEVYRRYILEIIPLLTPDPTERAALAKLIPIRG
jgi:geranylgeranyl diphosphate synthase type I